MTGLRATPALDNRGIASLLADRGAIKRAESFSSKPSVQFTCAEALGLARRVCELASGGDGVVVTHGTDCMEEVALLCDLIYEGDAPIVFTGAIRPASSPGADGPANLRDSVVVARDAQCAGLGVLVCFAGELHAAASVRKSDGTSPAAFCSPLSGPLGYVHEDRVWLISRPIRGDRLSVDNLDAQVEVVQVGLGSSGRLIELATAEMDGIVLVLPGAGHAPPQVLRALRLACRTIPAVVVPRPTRGGVLRATYGFEGAEPDIRAAGAICAAALSPAAARLKLIACLGGGLAVEEIRERFARDDL
jgi:L-asparaginase